MLFSMSIKIDNVIQKKCMKLPGLAAAVVAEAPSAIDNYCSSFPSLLRFLILLLLIRQFIQ